MSNDARHESLQPDGSEPPSPTLTRRKVTAGVVAGLGLLLVTSCTRRNYGSKPNSKPNTSTTTSTPTTPSAPDIRSSASDLAPISLENSMEPVEAIKKLQGSLESLEFWTGGVDGKIGHQTKLAVAAFQKLYDREITGEMTKDDFEVLELQNSTTVLDRVKTIYGEILERTVIIDLERQLLTVVDPDRVIASLSTSTGNNALYRSTETREMVRAITPKGNFRVNLLRPGTTHGPLGVYYDGVFFNGGIGFHGSNDVRINETASHGCARIPNFAAHSLITEMNLGVFVTVR